MRWAIDDGDWTRAGVHAAASLMTPPFELGSDIRIWGEPEISERMGQILAWWMELTRRRAD